MQSRQAKKCKLGGKSVFPLMSRLPTKEWDQMRTSRHATFPPHRDIQKLRVCSNNALHDKRTV